MTGSIMLIGAWLLVHHHCCATNQNEKSRNSFLIEQLSRRSNLEKNFMRFGRSPGPVFDGERQSISSRGGRGSDFMRFGRSSMARVADEKRGIPVRTGRDVDFIRFGRSMPVTREYNQDLYGNYGQAQDILGFDSLGVVGGEGKQESNGELDNTDDLRGRLGISSVFGNEKRAMKFISNDKMHYGRSGDSHAIQERGGRDSNFMRFGRAKGIETRANRDMNFMRFGRNPFSDDKNTMCSRALRSTDFMRFGRSPANNEEKPKEESKHESDGEENANQIEDFSKCLQTVSETIDKNKRGRPKHNFDNYIRLGRSGDQTASMDRTNRGADFMRFGRAPTAWEDETEVRESRAGRDSNFMRFGRSQQPMDGEEKRGLQARASQDFMRFGRASVEPFSEKEQDIQTRSGNKSGFIRFGRTPKTGGVELQNGIQMRSNQGFIRFGKSVKRGEGEDDEYAERLGRISRTLPSPFQPGFIFGPELSFLPSFSLHQPYSTANTDIIRFPG